MPEEEKLSGEVNAPSSPSLEQTVAPPIETNSSNDNN